MRLLLFYLVLVIAQGFLAALMTPLPTPDLFMIAVLTLLWRIQPWQLVLLAYAVGLLQDLMGAGVLGVLVQLAGVLVPPLEPITEATMRYLTPNVAKYLLESEIWLDWRHVFVHGPHGVWWTVSWAGAVAGVVVLALGVASGWLLWRAAGDRPMPA